MQDVVHPLRAWRQKHGISLRSLEPMMVDAVGNPVASHAQLSRVETGRQDPSFRLLMAVHELTDGAVTPNEFMWAAKLLVSNGESAAPLARPRRRNKRAAACVMPATKKARRKRATTQRRGR